MKCGLLVLIAGLLHLSQARVARSKGKCASNIQIMRDFDSEQFTGMWYQYASNSATDLLSKKCNSLQIEMDDSGNTAIVLKSNMNTPFSSYTEMHYGSMSLVSAGKLSMRLTSILGMLNSKSMYVLGTDYNRFLVIYYCESKSRHSRLRNNYVWIFTRDRQPSNETIQKAFDIITRQQLSTKLLQVIDHSNCSGDENQTTTTVQQTEPSDSKATTKLPNDLLTTKEKPNDPLTGDSMKQETNNSSTKAPVADRKKLYMIMIDH